MDYTLVTALIQHRILFLDGMLTAEAANRLVAQLLLLDAADPATAIDLYINSAGGAATDGMAVLDVLQSIQAPVHTICIGQAVSTAAWILAAGQPGHRAATRNALILPRVLASRGSELAGELEMHAAKILEPQVRAFMAECTGRKSLEAIESDTYLTAPEALACGIIDHVLEPAALRKLHRVRQAPASSQTRTSCSRNPTST